MGRFRRVMTQPAELGVLVPSSVPGVQFMSRFKESCFGILRPKRKMMLSVLGAGGERKREKSGNAGMVHKMLCEAYFSSSCKRNH